METIGVVLLILFILATYTFLHNKYVAYRRARNISLPPPPPQVTPTVVVSGVVIGQDTYYDINMPEIHVTVLSVCRGEVVLERYDGELRTLPVVDFLIQYAPRQTASISKLK